MKFSVLTECFSTLNNDLLKEMEEYSTLKNFSKKDFIVKQGSYIKNLPLVLEGRVKVFSTESNIQFLLYYISSGETCIYSFAHTFKNVTAEFSATAKTDSTLLLLPLAKVAEWLKIYPSFGNLVLSDYQKHYHDLLNTTKQITCYQLDQRVLNYLQSRSKLEKTVLLTVSHQEIADDLGTSREVISRVLKKLSIDHNIEQIGRKIKVG